MTHPYNKNFWFFFDNLNRIFKFVGGSKKEWPGQFENFNIAWNNKFIYSTFIIFFIFFLIKELTLLIFIILRINRTAPAPSLFL